LWSGLSELPIDAALKGPSLSGGPFPGVARHFLTYPLSNSETSNAWLFFPDKPFFCEIPPPLPLWRPSTGRSLLITASVFPPQGDVEAPFSWGAASLLFDGASPSFSPGQRPDGTVGPKSPPFSVTGGLFVSGSPFFRETGLFFFTVAFSTSSKKAVSLQPPPFGFFFSQVGCFFLTARSVFVDDVFFFTGRLQSFGPPRHVFPSLTARTPPGDFPPRRRSKKPSHLLAWFRCRTFPPRKVRSLFFKHRGAMGPPTFFFSRSPPFSPDVRDMRISPWVSDYGL